jgi:acetyltransferase-like isoleucine patch superfamily enzyme
MVKRRLINLFVTMLDKLLFISQQNKLKLIYNNPNVSVGTGVVIEEYFSANFPGSDFKVIFDDHIRIKKYCHILVFPGASLHIGENVFFNNYCSVNCLEKIEIGKNTMFGEGVKIYDHNHSFSYENDDLVVVKDQFETAPVIIGKNCWIGSNVTLLKGVTIGNNVVIGANNLIYQSIADNTVVKLKTDYIKNINS